MSTKFTLFQTRAFDGTFVRKEGEIIKEFSNGYLTRGGAWSRYMLEDSDIHALFWEVRWKGKRKHSVIPRNGENAWRIIGIRHVEKSWLDGENLVGETADE